MVLVLDAKKPPGAAGPASSALLAAPLHTETKPSTVGPFAVVVHAKIPETAAGALPVDADVRPHPHIGLTAISYVVEGSVTHRDSHGNRRELRAGDMGATVSGKGIVHSERMERMRLHGGSFEMFQLLLAHPDGFEDCDPTFFFRAKEEIEAVVQDGATARYLFPAPPGAPTGMPSPEPILLADVSFESNAQWPVPDAPERALYVREGEVYVGGTRIQKGQIAVLGAEDKGDAALVRAVEPAHLLAFGGTSVGPRYMWWNYIHSSLEKIEAAKAAWREGKVPLPQGDTESFTACPADNGRPLLLLNSLMTPASPKGD